MLPTLFKTWLPHRFLFPARRRFRDQPDGQRQKNEVSIIRLVAFFVGGVLLANLVLMTSALLGASAEQRGSLTDPAEPASVIATDARATPDMDEQVSVAKAPDPVFARVAESCAEQAREKLTIGLTHYYMQRMMTPGSPSEEASDGAGLADLMAGPGDPAATAGKSWLKFCTG